MKKVLKVGFNEYEILDSRELYEGEPLRFGDRRTAAQFLRRFQRTPMGSRIMRDFVERSGAMGAFSRMEDGVVVERLAVMLVSRRVVIVPRAAIYVVPSPDVEEPAVVIPELATATPLAQPRPEDKKKKKTFIKFRVLDHRTGKPVEGVPLIIRLPDYGVVKWVTDASGMVEIFGIDPGTCVLRRVKDSDGLEVLKLEAGGG